MDSIKAATRCQSNSETPVSWFKTLKLFKPFKPPPLFLPRDAGEDTGGGWNDLNYLNGWNSDEHIPIAIDAERGHCSSLR
jgi:hypothetical protein